MKLTLNVGERRGVYRIFHIDSGKSYVGSSIDIPERINEHIRALRGGTHHSPILQHAWNKYGSRCFSSEVLEIVSDDLISLRLREVYYTSHYSTHKSNGGYNILLETELRCGWAEQQRGNAGSYVVASPDGIIYQVRFLSDFCEMHNLDKNSMYKVGRGKFTHHKYWRCWKSEEVPDEITNLDDFSDSYKIVRDDRNRKKLIKFNETTRKRIVFADPIGNLVECNIGIKNFAKKYELSYDALKKLSSGKQMNHQGWTLHQPST